MQRPTKEEFLELARDANLIPVSRRLLADFETPLSAYVKIRGRGESFLFESVEGGEHIGRYSFVGSNPCAVIRQFGSHVETRQAGGKVERFRVKPEGPRGPGEIRDALEAVEKTLGQYRTVGLPHLPRFTGGAIGYLGYEFVHDVNPKTSKPSVDPYGAPTVYLVVANELLIFDRVDQSLTVLANAYLPQFSTPEEAYADAVKRIDRMVALLAQPLQPSPTRIPERAAIPEARSNVSKERFLERVRRAKKYIAAGDIIQVVGSQRFSTPYRGSAVSLYRAARTVNPSPYMFLLEFEGLSLVGASPEIHVRCEDGVAAIRPIAGTRPRGSNPDQDKRLEEELKADPKERAEHVMLVDLARNDLGRVCEIGTVKVRDLMIVERYSHVMHLVSHVEGKLSPQRTSFDLMRATFPAGTLTGAPKIRAMQIIAELEGEQRGPYGGCVGYFSFNGNLDSCITIRTAVLKDGIAYVQAGGGWVADSIPESEYVETVNKAKAMLKATAMAEQLEPAESGAPESPDS